jgi:hypothetical protein
VDWLAGDSVIYGISEYQICEGGGGNQLVTAQYSQIAKLGLELGLN